ncbi:MAG: hypothetical protein IKK39_00190 [Thermoguttaceae bacterium]|nr:hypothetical protein [Thermoguttaceae bacterium]MBR4102464.1 hypothetical protein [Thermoguttaceae bacterium]
MNICRIASVFAFSTASVFAVGCSQPQKPDGMPELYPCVVKLTQEGEPLADASILCLSDDPKLIRWAVTGRADANGVAKIFTMGKFEGAPLGDFAVVVSKNAAATADAASVSDDLGASGTTANEPVVSLVSLEFTEKATTPLRMTVEAKSNEFEFDCGAKVKIERSAEAI